MSYYYFVILKNIYIQKLDVKLERIAVRDKLKKSNKIQITVENELKIK